MIRWLKDLFSSEDPKVFTLKHTTIWTDCDNSKEDIAILLIESPNGRRSYKVLDHGYNKIYKIWKTTWLRVAVKQWMLGMSAANISKLYGKDK